MSILKRLFSPSDSTLARTMLAMGAMAILGAVAGVLIWAFFGWLVYPAWSITPTPPSTSGLLRVAAGGSVYALVFYLTFGLIAHLRRRYELTGATLWGIYWFGWLLALALLGITLGVVQPDDIFGRAIRSVTRDPNAVRVLVGATLLFVLVLSFRLALERLKAQKVAADARARLKTLQAQMNPHFFFNTLNTIYALIPDDPSAAQRMVSLLAEIHRHVFSKADADLIPLTDELRLATAYLEIEKVRFGERLRCTLPEEAEMRGVLVPALSVQPLVENAVRHGIGQRLEGGKVTVNVQRSETQFELTVQNECATAIQHSENDFFRDGHALNNIRERLKLHFGSRALLAVSFPRPNAVAITMTGPIS
jgi:hypothetical protein